MALTEDEREKREFELNKLVFDKSLDQRKFEIDNFWKRGWFFGALLLVLITGFFGLKKDHSTYCIIVSFLGLLVSFFQCLMNRGSKYWQERWESKTKHQESILDIDLTKTKKFNEKERYYLDAGILAKNENRFTVARRFSVSKLTFLVWDIITFFWLFVWLREWGWHPFSNLVEVIVFHIIIVSYIYLFFFSKGPYKEEKKNEEREEGKKVKRKWYSLIYTGGGKALEELKYELKELKEIPDNVRQPYFNDSEAYVKNLIKDPQPPKDTHSETK